MYRVEYLPRAVEDLEQLDRTVSHHIFRRLRWLADHFNSISPEPLKGDFGGLFKFRVGDYRIIYEVDRTLKVITVHLVGHRRDIYS
jgi:mRNA interferase RelE/StbE